MMDQSGLGEDNVDEIRLGNDGKPLFLSNQAGGILGGISSGQPVVCRFAVKPTSSILTPRRTIDRFGKETDKPVLYLRGLSTGDFRPALEGLLGEAPAGSRRRGSAA